MSIETDIEWCDSTVNPTMGCDGCELWGKTNKSCYAGVLHQRYGGSNKGFSPRFEILTQHPGRMTKAAAWSDLTGTDRPEKPWLNGLPRHTFVSDMSDALSKDVPFEYLKTEVIDNVTSPKGRRHVYMWLTKRPSRMVELSGWLSAQGIAWPSNIMAGTSITDQATANSRTAQILRMPGRRFLSVEPMTEAVDFGDDDNGLGGPFNRLGLGFDLVIIGGESGPNARPFDLAWGHSIINQCKATGVPVFMKQVGSRPENTDPTLRTGGIRDRKGGNPSEWPEDLRVRQMPEVKS